MAGQAGGVGERLMERDRGLCAVCRQAAACRRPDLLAQPIWECGDFAACSPPTYPAPLEASDPRIDAGDAYQDLCSTCESREACKRTRPEGGVWRCDGYSWSVRSQPIANGFDLEREAWTMTEIARIVDKHRGERGELIAVLEEIQAKYSYLPEEALRVVAEETGRSLVDVYGVATFFRAFSLKPRGRHLLTCCLGTACHVRGAPRVVRELERQLEVKAGDTTNDREITLETQNCLGGCALGPILVADGHYFSNVNPATVAGIIDRTRAGLGATIR